MRCKTRASDKKTEKGLGSRINYNKQDEISTKHLKAGDVSNKIPVHLSDGKTIVFAKSEEDVERVRALWEKRVGYINR